MVTLKQRTYTTLEGKAVGHGNPNAAFLVGGEGGKVSDETAVSLGLINGALPENTSAEQLEFYEGRGRGEDKTGRRTAGQGRPLSVPKPKKGEEKESDKAEDKAAKKAPNKGFGKGATKAASEPEEGREDVHDPPPDAPSEAPKE